MARLGFALTLTLLAVTCAAATAAAGAEGTAAGAVAANPAPADNSAAVTKAVQICSTCHGPYGVSVSPEFPNLAGQHESYLIAQLHAFQHHTRAEKLAHDFMWGMAGLLDEETIKGLAKYYSEQKPAPPRPGDPELVAKGKAIFAHGFPERGVLACSACHGPEGKGTVDYPRLAGQNATYVVHQLEAIQSAARAAPVMHGIVQNLTPAEMVAVAQFVQSL